MQPELEKIRCYGKLKSGVEVLQPDALFPRVEWKMVEKEVPTKKQKQEKAMQPKVSEEGLVTFDQVMAVKLKTARIVEAKKIEGADKLLKLQVDLGSEKRQIVAEYCASLCT